MGIAILQRCRYAARFILFKKKQCCCLVRLWVKQPDESGKTLKGQTESLKMPREYYFTFLIIWSFNLIYWSRTLRFQPIEVLNLALYIVMAIWLLTSGIYKKGNLYMIRCTVLLLYVKYWKWLSKVHTECSKGHIIQVKHCSHTYKLHSYPA